MNSIVFGTFSTLQPGGGIRFAQIFVSFGILLRRVFVEVVYPGELVLISGVRLSKVVDGAGVEVGPRERVALRVVC